MSCDAQTRRIRPCGGLSLFISHDVKTWTDWTYHDRSIIVRFHLGGFPMGSIVDFELASRDITMWRTLRPNEVSRGPAMFYVRVSQQDGQRAWTSPIRLE